MKDEKRSTLDKDGNCVVKGSVVRVDKEGWPTHGVLAEVLRIDDPKETVFPILARYLTTRGELSCWKSEEVRLVPIT